jgi:hypothetical protein
MLKCSACGALSSDAVLEAAGGTMPDRGVVAVRIRICDSCYSRPERSQLLARLCAEILAACLLVWSDSRLVFSRSHGSLSARTACSRFWYEPDPSPRSIEPDSAEWQQ